MFKRLTTSLSRPSQTVFFMKDRWRRVILYILLLPLILMIPMVMTILVDPSMSIDRYEMMKQTIEEDFRVENAAIVDGFLTYETSAKATFSDLFTFYIGQQELDNRTFNFVFKENKLVFYIADIEIDQVSYSELDLLNHDFSSMNDEELRTINLALKSYIENQSYITFVDLTVQYIFGLMDYLFVVLLMSLMMLIFVTHVKFPFKLRFKLSVYLSTVWILSEFILSLFHAQQLEFISMLLVYVYHILAFRSFKVIKGVIK